MIDAHVHFNEPGRTDWEGWATGTRALAAGGATACIEMPLNAHPPTIDGAAFDAKRRAARAAAVVDFALWGGIVPGNLDRLDELAERGVVGFKAFMCDSGIEDFPAADDDTLAAGMARAAALDLPVAVHAEDPADAARRHGAPTGAPSSPHARSRPSSRRSSARSSSRGRPAARCTSCTSAPPRRRLSSRPPASTPRARPARTTCTLTDDDLEPLGTRAKCAPPLRSAQEREQLWEAIGDIALIASDHSPCPPDMKRGVFTAAWGGIAGCQTLLPLLLDSGHARPSARRCCPGHTAQAGSG